MTRHHKHDTLSENSINLLLEHGLAEGLPRIIEMMLNTAMLIERNAHLGAAPYERSENRNGYANRLKDRSFQSSAGKLALRVPQTRDCEPYQPSMLESGSRVDRALKVAIAEMYIQRVSTRRGAKVMERLCGLEVTSDAHEGLKAALKAVFNASPWQRCQFHLQQNAQAYVPKLDMRESVAADIRTVFNADTRANADERLDALVEKYRKSAPELSAWVENAIPEGLEVFNLPEHKRKKPRTSNISENLNTQIKRRTKVAGLFPNTDSILRLVTAILMEISEEWETGKAYLNNHKTNS